MVKKPDLKPRIPDIAGNKKYDDYSPKDVGDAAVVDKKLSGKSKGLLAAMLVVSAGVGFAAVQVTKDPEPVAVVAEPTATPAPTERAVVAKEGTTENDEVIYDKNVSTSREPITVGGIGTFWGQYSKDNYERSMAHSRNMSKKYSTPFKFYPVVGQDEQGIDILSDGNGYGFRAGNGGDTLYGLLYGDSNSVQKWLDEYAPQFPEITSIHRSLPDRLMSGNFAYDDVSLLQRVAAPDMLITVSGPGDYAGKVKGFTDYIGGLEGLEKDFKVTVQVAGWDVLGKHIDGRGQTMLTYENFYTNVAKADLGEKYEFDIKATI